MRISRNEATLLKDEIRAHVPDADVYLFGSRADDASRGGDIDVLVTGSRKLTLGEESDVRMAFCNKFGEQKIDIVSYLRDEDSPFRRVAEEHAVLL